MAKNRIKGITIEIGGDTKQLQDSLKEVNSKLKDTQSALKDVDSLLKMDPGNVELLKQKQEYLNTAIEETSKKLEQEKQALQQMKENNATGEVTEQQRALEREIAETEKSLESLEGEMQTFGSIGKQQVEAVAQSMAQMGEKVQTAGKKVTAVGDTMTAAVSAPIAAAGAGALKAAMGYEDALAKLSTIADTTEVPMEELSNQILELSKTSGISAETIAGNVYDAISAGQKTADAVNFVSNATQLARAGFTSTDAALDILTTSLNAYGLAAEDVGRVSDVLINTQNLGKTTVDQLASSMGKVIPTAKANGVEIETLAGAYAVMTANGIATAETTTYFNSMLNELGKNGSSAANAFAEATSEIKEGGLTMSEAMEMGWSLSDVLNALDKQAASQGTTISNMFGSAEAGKAAAVLLDNSEKLDAAITAMGDSAGATEAAYAKLNTTSFEVDKTINELKIALIEIGNVLKSELAPIFEKVVKKIKELTSAFSNMSAAEKEQVVKIAGIVAAIGPLLAVGGRLITGIGTVMTMAPQIGTALSALTGPVGIVIAAVAALAAAFAALWTSDEGFREGVTGIFTDIQGAIQPLIDALGALWGAFQELLGSLWDVFGTEVMALFNLVFVETIFPIIQNLVEIFTGVVNLIVDIIHGDWSAAWEDLKSIVLNLLEILVDNVLGFFNKLLQTVGSITSKLVKGVIDLFMSLGHETATIINDLITDAINFWKDLFNKTIEIFGNIWDGIKEKVSGIKDAVVDGISGAVEFLSELPEKALTWGRDLIMSFINGIKEKVGQLTDEIEAVAEDIAAFLGFSEPDKGPLSNFHTFAPDMMDLFTKGIRDNIPEVRKAAEDMAAAVAQPVNASTLTFNIANTINGAPGQNINDLAIAVDRRITTSVAQRRSAWA
jgi:TP901 family phage tail tape measure protein